MPIAKIPSVVLPNPAQPPRITTPETPNVVVDSRYTPRKSLITYAQGSNWQAQFYKQILTDDEEPRPFQHEEQGTTQQYLRVNRYIFKVTTDLQHNPIPEQGQMEITGSSIMLPGLVPNEGDMFIADVGDGRAGLFAITNIDIKSIYLDGAYEVEYAMTDFVTPTLQALIDAHVVQEAVYDLDFARTGKNPIVSSTDYADRDALTYLEKSLIAHFFPTFYSQEFSTFLVPEQNRTTYDPYHTRFVDRLIAYEERPKHERVYVVDETVGGDQKPVTLWDLVVTQDVNQFAYLTKVFQAIGNEYFRSSTALLGQFAYFGPYYCVYPITLKVNTNQDLDHPAKDPSTDPTSVAKLLLPVVQITPTYVLSAAFYNQDRPNMTTLELETHNLVTGQPIDVSVIKTLVGAYFHAPALVAYYSFPLLVALCRAARYRI